MNDMEVHVAYVRLDISDDDNRHVAASMASVMENTSSKIHFHIFYDEGNANQNQIKTRDNINKYITLVNKYSQKINFHAVRLGSEFASNPCNYRLLMPDILQEVDIIISLGYDTIVNLDLSTLLDTYPITSYSISACIDTTFVAIFDQWDTSVKNYYSNIGIKKETYCNADVMIFNLAKIREEQKFPNTIFDFLHQYPHAWHNEQDALNSIFRDDCYILPQRYNIQSRDETFVKTILDQYPGEGYIIHSKAWLDGLGPIDCLYWHYLALTPWGERKQLFDYMGKTFTTPLQVINNFEEYLKYYSYNDIIHILWSFTIPLYIKLIYRYIHYLKCGYMDYRDLKD